MLYSTMQDVPLTLTSILRHGTDIHGDHLVITATEDGYRQIDYREFGARVAQLANALQHLRVRPSDRVATFMWNNQEHLEAYFAIPCMGAVLHTLNIRLSDEQIEFIAYDAEDTVVLVDMSLAKQLAGVLARMETVRTVVGVGDGDTTVLETAGKDVVRYDELLATQRTEFAWPDVGERSAPAMCYTSDTTGHRRAWCTATARPICTAPRVQHQRHDPSRR